MCVDLCLDLQFDSTDQHVCFMLIPCSFYKHGSVGQLEIWNDKNIQQCSCCFVVIWLSWVFHLFFCMKLRIVLSRSVKNCVGILIGIALNLQIAFAGPFLLLVPLSMGDLSIF